MKYTFNLTEQNGVQAIARTTVTSRAGEPASDTGKPKPAISKYPLEVDTGYDYAPWGGDDQYPNRVYAKLSKVAIAEQAVTKMAKRMFGNGLIYVKEADLQKTAKPERHYHPDVELFLQENHIETEWLFPQCMEWQVLWNTFHEMKLSLSKRFIVALFHKEAPFCRLSKQDVRGNVNYLLYDTRFAFSRYHRSQLNQNERNSDGTITTAIPLMTWWDANSFFKKLRGYTFAWHSRPRFGRQIYYPMPPAQGLFKTNGWLDSAADVPRIVNAMQKNQINLKYQILVDSEYFRIIYPEWDNYDSKQREIALDKFEDDINRKLVSPDKQYSSIISIFDNDNLTGNTKGKIEVIAIDDKIKSDAWVPGAERANFEIVQGLGAHPTDFGLARENGSMGAGSGSDKREVWNSQILENTIEQMYVLAPLNFIARYNRWGVRFFIDHTAHTTSNDQESGLKKNEQNIEAQ